MDAKEWIENILAHPEWGHVEIEWEAVDEIQDMLNFFQVATQDEFKKCILSEEKVNKYREALEYIAIATNGGDGIIKEMNVLAELVVKTTPKKVKLIKHFYDVNDMYIGTKGKCPVCQKWVLYKADDRYGYCHYCGQKIDWSEEE